MSILSLRDKYLFDVNEYEVVRKINKGGFGVIYLVKNKNTGKEYAAKTNLIQKKADNKLFISREVAILIKVQHPTIVQFQGFSYVDFKERKNITFLMDFMKKGSLSSILFKDGKKKDC